MKKEKRILEEVEKTLNLFDELPVLEENHFLYTKIKAASNNKLYSSRQKSIFALKPIVIVIIILLNIITLTLFYQSSKSSYSIKESLIKSLQSDYKINQTFNEYLSIN